MIQMLEDVNEINMMLKITQTRMQKEVKIRTWLYIILKLHQVDKVLQLLKIDSWS